MNASTFNSFVPKATITANKKTFKNALIFSGFVLLFFVVSIKINEKKYIIKDDEIFS